MTKALYINYTKNNDAPHFVVVSPYALKNFSTGGDLFGFDISSAVKESIKIDKSNGLEAMTGPSFAWTLKNSMAAMNQHTFVSNGWRKAYNTRNESFTAYVDHLLVNAKNSVDVIDTTVSINIQQLIKDMKVDFRPKIGFEPGNWKTFKNSFVTINKEWSPF
jgi:hypothetical protein